MKPWSSINAAVLVLVPLVSMVAWEMFLEAKGPYWLGLNTDPDYAYLLNAANLARGLAPGHADHPGTVVQLIGAGIIRVAHELVGTGDLADDVVRRPEQYLSLINRVFFGLLAISLVILGITTRTVTGRMDAALLVQLTPFLSRTIPTHLACVKPEPLLLILASLAGALALKAAKHDRTRESSSLALCFGLVCGTALTAKITAASLLLLPLVILAMRRSYIIFLTVTVLTFCLLTWPAWPILGDLFLLTEQIATHSGQYGSGSPGWFHASTYLTAVLRILASEPLMSLGMVVGLAAIAVSRRVPEANQPMASRVLAATLTAQIGCLLMVARHPYNEYLVPGVHYLFPGLGLTGVSLALGWSLLAPSLQRVRWKVTAAVATLLMLAFQVNALVSVHGALVHTRDLQLEVSRLAQERYPGRVIFYYRSSSQAHALHFGDKYAGMRYGQQIARSYPQAIYYDIWARKIEPPDVLLPPKLGGPDTVFAVQGTPLRSRPTLQSSLPGVLVIVAENEREALYEIRIPGPKDQTPK